MKSIVSPGDIKPTGLPSIRTRYRMRLSEKNPRCLRSLMMLSLRVTADGSPMTLPPIAWGPRGLASVVPGASSLVRKYVVTLPLSWRQLVRTGLAVELVEYWA